MPRLTAAASVERLNGADYVQSLSDAATYALIALFLTGAYNGWHLVGAPANLLGAYYGKVLLLKLALVLVAAGLGGHNRFFEMPTLLAALRQPTSSDSRRLISRFTTVLRVESVFLLAVLVAAGVLVASALPGTE